VPATMMTEKVLQLERIAGGSPANEAICPVVTISLRAGPLNPMAPFQPGVERLDPRPESGEGAARAALDSRTGRTLTDADWAVAKDRLLAFFNILRGWDRKARAVSRDLVMCEVPCLREL
jgi:hypothetical protein